MKPTTLSVAIVANAIQLVREYFSAYRIVRIRLHYGLLVSTRGDLMRVAG